MSSKEERTRDELGHESSAHAGGREHFVFDNDNLNHRVARLIAHFMSQFIQVGRANWHRKLAASFTGAGKQPHGGEETRERPSCWPLLVLAFYLYMTAKLTAVIYFETMRFYHGLRLSRLTDSTSQSAAVAEAEAKKLSPSSGSPQLAELSESLAATEWWLVFLGSPYTELGMQLSVGYLALMWLTFGTYIIPQIYANYIVPTRPPIVDLLLDEKRAVEEQCRQLIEEQLVYVINSSRNNVGLKKARIEDAAFYLWTELIPARRNTFSFKCECAERGTAFSCRRYSPLVEVACGEHRQLLEQVEVLRGSGKLVPMNRAQEWVDRALVNFNTVMLGNAAYSLVLDLLIALFTPRLFGRQLRLLASDIVQLVEVFAYAEINVLTTGFGLALFNASCADQTEYLIKLDEEIDSCIRLNESHFWELIWDRMGGRDGDGEARLRFERMIDPYPGQLNARLLETLLKYRIYLAQLGPVRNPWPIVIIMGLIVTVILPFTMRLYLPYVMVDSKKFTVVLSVTFVLYADSLLAPICKFHLKGQQLFKKLSSLLAHTIELDRVAARRLGRNIYAENTVALLRKDLSHPNRLMDRFVSSAFGLEATFPNLVEAHFYYGILMISLFSELESWRVLFGRRLNDPFLLL